MPKPGKRVIPVTRCLLDMLFAAKPNGERRFNYITSDAPEDLHLTGLFEFDWDRDVFRFVAESAEWSEVPEGTKIPEFTPQFTGHY